MNYLKLNDNRYNLVGEGMVCDGTKLQLFVSSEDLSITDIKTIFSNHDEILVYDCVNKIDSDTGEFYESDEFVATRFEGFTRIISINYDAEYDFYCITLVSPIDIDTRMADMESAMNFLLMGGDE